MNLNRLGITLLTSATAIALTTIPTIAQTDNPTNPQPNGGIEFEASPTLNQTTMVQNWVNHEMTYEDTSVTYKSAHCRADEEAGYIPNNVHGPTVLISARDVTPYKSGRPRTKAFFRSRTTPPAEGLRVVIRNHAIDGGKTPYADREYAEGNQSEKFYISPETEHKTKYLSIQPGANRMSYEIRRGKQVLESGEFIANITIADQYITKTITRSPSEVTIPCIRKRHHEHGKKHKQHHDRYDYRDRH